MYISDLPFTINKFNCLDIANALTNANIMHRAVISSVSTSESERGKAVWRIDQIDRTSHLIIVSENKPNAEFLKEFFKQEEDIQTKTYDSYLKKAGDGTEWVFKLRANAVKNQKKDDSYHKIPIKDYEGQLNWLEKQGKENGFELIGLPIIEKEFRQLYHNDKKENRTKFFGIDFVGRLRVTNAEKFQRALCDGIGRARSFGFGLLTITPTKND